jgi:hypothetical protein
LLVIAPIAEDSRLKAGTKVSVATLSAKAAINANTRVVFVENFTTGEKARARNWRGVCDSDDMLLS